ncbi:gag protein [Moniliophthora roreri MCA 2997]|uniref:Gag protein n=1 Tax=Moniliophthora roreri (strain MCA 2997) TaxID=1381753 RepID=V2W1G8_MONRO|nr:gag protein [Moniliophthora roreri MCA 2997]
MTMPTIPPSAPRPSTASITPFAPPAHDPNAIEVNATKSRLDWTHMMAGKCYGCGSTQHTKANGNHEHEICGHCGQAGHHEAVCFDKWAGKPKARRVAASESLSAKIPGPSSSEPLPTPGSPPPNFNDMLAQLHQLSAQFAALKQSF